MTPEAGTTWLSSPVIFRPENCIYFICVLLSKIVNANLKFVCDISIPKNDYLFLKVLFSCI